MKILICGDVVGRSGREIVEKEIPILRKKEKIDFVVLNGENAASGFGITKKICEKFYSIGIDVITSGNHIWDQKEILDYINKDLRLLRPCNFPMNSPGSGYGTYKIDNGKIICVINVMCRLFMDSLESPFESVKKIIELIKSKYDDVIILVDVHGESTSEKMALAHFFDGQVNAIFGTHTHVPTADLQVLEKGSFFQTDLGMCGDYDSVIGMSKQNSLNKFLKKDSKKHFPATGDATLCGVIVDCDIDTGLAVNVKSYLFGNQLKSI